MSQWRDSEVEVQLHGRSFRVRIAANYPSAPCWAKPAPGAVPDFAAIINLELLNPGEMIFADPSAIAASLDISVDELLGDLSAVIFSPKSGPLESPQPDTSSPK